MIKKLEKVTGMNFYFVQYETTISSCIWCVIMEQDKATPVLNNDPTYTTISKKEVKIEDLPVIHQQYIKGLSGSLESAARDRSQEPKGAVANIQAAFAKTFKKAEQNLGIISQAELDKFCPMTTTDEDNGLRYVTNGNGYVISINYMKRSELGLVVDLDGKKVRTSKHIQGPFCSIPAGTEAELKVMVDLE